MRRIGAFLAAVLLLVCMAVPVFAVTGATSVQGVASVASDGSCHVNLTVAIHLDAPVDKLTFPVPDGARSITLNGSSARTSRSGGMLQVDLSRIVGSVAGDYTVAIGYSLSDITSVNLEGKPELNLPLLCGFAYPVQSLSFTVTLPGLVTTTPVFSSGYYQQGVESNMTVEVSGASIQGSVNMEMKDLETLTMTLEVTEEMFPGIIQRQWRSNFDNIAMWVFAALAALYWLIFLQCPPLTRSRCTTAPEGYTAGQLGCILAGQGADLTMMVFTWARYGYILIQMSDQGRVVLHKRMEMGNERSAYEQKLFAQLFGRRRMVDGNSFHYAQLCRRAAASSGSTKSLTMKFSGNRRIFRILCAAVGLFAGISLGNALSGNAILGFLLALIFAILCAVGAWLIQDWVRFVHLGGKTELFLALGCGAVWLLLAALGGDLPIALAVVLGQFAAGLLYAYGGRKTSMGRQLASQVLGLRQFLRSAPKEQLHRMLSADPDFFFHLAPAAMALGSCEAFARRFGKRRISGCPYLTTGMDGHRTAAEWCQLMQRAADSLNARYKRLFLEMILSR